MHHFFKHLTKKEHKIFGKLNTPKKIQDFLELLPINFEEKGDTLYSPRAVLSKNKAHCFEGAIFAAAALLYHGKPAIIMDLQPGPKDDGHAIALYKSHGRWGAISKTNHAVLRFRDPVYLTPRELVMSYFHEYFLDSGVKTLRTYTVFALKTVKKNWVIDDDIWYLDKALDNAKYTSLLSLSAVRNLRRADEIEINAGKILSFKRINKNPLVKRFKYL